jgi:hypothetical protein
MRRAWKGYLHVLLALGVSCSGPPEEPAPEGLENGSSSFLWKVTRSITRSTGKGRS